MEFELKIIHFQLPMNSLPFLPLHQISILSSTCVRQSGTGLSDSLTEIELTFDCAEKPKLLSVGENIATVGNCSMYHFIPAANYIAAIIVNAQIPKQQIDFWNW